MMSARIRSRSSAGSRSASCSVWMFARRLAIGVRSSWLASATRWRWASTERSRASSVVLKLRARRASSSSPTTSIRCDGSRSPASCSVRLVKRADRHQRRPRHQRAQRRRRARCPPRPARSAPRAGRLSWSSTSSSGRATCTAPPPGQRLGEHADVRAVDLPVGQLAALARRRDLAGLVVHRQLGVRAGPAQHRARSMCTNWATPWAPPNGASAGGRRRRRGRRGPPPGPAGRRRRAAAAATCSARSVRESSISPRSEERTAR